MKSVAIIGAGIAGIALARQLQDSAEVRIFEKSRGFGGRMATRRSGSFQFDHGAQFFTARTKQFQSLLSVFMVDKQIQAWLPRITTLGSEKPYKREWFEPHYIALPSMNGLCKTLAQGLNVSLNTEVASIEALDESWLLKDTFGKPLGHFDWVISATPAPQAEELLPDCFDYKSILNAVDFSPCFSLMLGYESTHKLNFDVAIVKNSPLSWIAANCSKPGRPPFFSLVVHSDNEWARKQFECNINDVRRSMLEALGNTIGTVLPLHDHIAIHRWKYAKVQRSCEESFLLDRKNRLAACGDWCGGNRVETAYISGLNLGDELLRVL